MTYNQYRMIFYVSFTAFAIMLIASIVILIVLEIPKVIGALTGKSARKGIAAIVQKQTAGHIDITSSGPIAPSYNLAGENKKKPGYTQNIDETTVLDAPTEVLQDETTVLEDITEKLQKGNKFSIITLVFQDATGKTGEVPELLKTYVWKQPSSDLEALQEIIKALPVKLGEVRYK